jgi:hypothetical protein
LPILSLSSADRIGRLASRSILILSQQLLAPVRRRQQPRVHLTVPCDIQAKKGAVWLSHPSAYRTRWVIFKASNA